MTGIEIALGIVVLAVILRLLTRLGRPARTERRYRNSKMITRKGDTTTKVCGDCGRASAHCRHLTRNAEHAEGMHGPRTRR